MVLVSRQAIDEVADGFRAASDWYSEAIEQRNEEEEKAKRAADEIEKRMADDAMMQARIDELKEALRPFAEAVIAADRKADKAGFARSFDQYSVDWKFTFGEMRRAAAVARASDGGEDE